MLFKTASLGYLNVRNCTNVVKENALQVSRFVLQSKHSSSSEHTLQTPSSSASYAPPRGECWGIRNELQLLPTPTLRLYDSPGNCAPLSHGSARLTSTNSCRAASGFSDTLVQCHTHTHTHTLLSVRHAAAAIIITINIIIINIMNSSRQHHQTRMPASCGAFQCRMWSTSSGLFDVRRRLASSNTTQPPPPKLSPIYRTHSLLPPPPNSRASANRVCVCVASTGLPVGRRRV